MCAKLFVKIYKADGLLKRDECLWAQVRRRFLDPEEVVDPYVEVTFNGLKGSTSKRKKTTSPAWKEQIVFSMDFPFPLDDLIVHVRDDEIVGDRVIGSMTIPLDKISNPRDNGFLPTFGPCYVHLHDLTAKEDLGAHYRGRLLMAINSEIFSYREYSEPSVSVELTDPLPEGSFGYESEFFLAACIHEATMINKKAVINKDIRFTLQLGNYGRNVCDVGEIASHCCDSQKPMSIDKKYMYLPFDVCKPFLSMEITWPDNSRRLYASNILLKIVQRITELTENAKADQRSLDLNDLAEMTKDCLKILKEYEEMYSATTELDKERFRTYESDIVESFKYICGTSSSEETPEGIMNELDLLKEKLKLLAENPQVMFPDIVLWMECNSKRIGYVTVPANEILFAVRDHERGQSCGKRQTFFLSPISRKRKTEISLMAKIECSLWLGPCRHQNYSFELLAKGMSKIQGGDGDHDEPVVLQSTDEDQEMYEVRAHLYQARSLSYSNLSRRNPDCFAKVYVKNTALTTQVSENTLSPVWDETLIFPGLLLEKTVSEVAIIVEILALEKPRFLGRMVTTLHLSQHPRRLRWHEVELMGSADDANLLASFEIFKSDQSVVALETGILPIPDDIRPHFSKYRLEILFWGLRKMKRVHLLEITRPCIEVECKDHFIRSDAIFDYKKHSNFSRMVQYLDIDLADQEDYFPPLTIKLLSSSGFGRIDIVATHVVASLQTYSFRGQIHSSSHEVVQIELDENPDSYYIQKITFPWTLNNVVKNTENEEEEEENIDWWARFYISMNLCFLSEETQSFDRKSGEGITKKPLELNKASRLSSFSQHVFRVAALDNGFQKPILNSQNARAFTVYDCELENVAEFGGLKQWLHSFDLKRGKRFSRLKDNIIAIFKVRISLIYS
nr:otoferlin-like [Parasteatoda tepidariorum]